MGRMHDALRKAAEERDRKRRHLSGDVASGVPDLAGAVPAVAGIGSTQALTAEIPVSAPRTAEVHGHRGTPPVEEMDLEERPPAHGGRAARALEMRAREEGLRDEAAPVPDAPAPAARTVDPRIVTFHSPLDPRTEQFRSIRASLLSLRPSPRSILITSGSPGEGKSAAAVNLAVTLVEGGTRRVLLIDGNLRNPELDTLVGARPGPGLSDILDGRSEDLAQMIQSTPIPGVDLLPCGTVLDNPGGLLQPRAFSGVLGLVEDRYHFIIVDASSLDEVADAAVLAPEVDGVILAVALEGAARNVAERALEQLDTARARVLGAIAMNCRE